MLPATKRSLLDLRAICIPAYGLNVFGFFVGAVVAFDEGVGVGVATGVGVGVVGEIRAASMVYVAGDAGRVLGSEPAMADTSCDPSDAPAGGV